MNDMISVIIIDDHPLVLNGFEFIFDSHADIRLLDTFTNAGDALKFLKNNHLKIALSKLLKLLIIEQ